MTATALILTFTAGALFAPSLVLTLWVARTLLLGAATSQRILAATVPTRNRNRALAASIAYSAQRLRFVSVRGVTLMVATGGEAEARNAARDALIDLPHWEPRPVALRDVRAHLKETD